VSTGTGEGEDPEPDKSALEEAWDSTYHHSPFVREIRRLKEMRDYQRRGYDFQDFVGSLFKDRHFNVVPSPGTAKPRQTDLLATRGDDAYLIETKWRRSKANIADIDSLFNRLDAVPATVLGLMVSYAGFTEEAIRRVELRSDRPVILIMGSELEQLVERERDIVQVLAQKRSALLTHRRVFFGATHRRQGQNKRGLLAAASAEFVFLDGTRTKWISGGGAFGEFTFVQELPDVDWAPGEGRAVIFDMAVPVFDERGIVALLHHLSGMGWATDSARWSIQQTVTNWHGMGSKRVC
jgi:Restriction endonuclease